MFKKIVFLFAIFHFSCASNIKQNTTSKRVVVYESKPCYGRCEAFSLTLFEDKKMEYDGFKNTKKSGKFYAKITTVDFKKIKILINKLDYENLKTDYTSKRTDLHLRILILNSLEKQKTIFLRDEIPIDILNLEKEINRLVKKYEFKKE
ncbi:DUF6438 domain-containing protein [Flavobacterium restrictum]|uniref:DUF6438 domain-containing protein n=1 Tax=Flavobacterium restrictum TaxID=2594428 RepID=A0A553EC37_9FLAO|nr:DUF6438 domain-containing protein [Flavobacterium restrictum]TRX42343.1 hypothetical protein FNW21_03535 [Flavobacterium restrictum]